MRPSHRRPTSKTVPMPIPIDEQVTFRKLEVLLAFLESGSLGRAAERLGTSAVSVHRALHSLEAGVRCPLFRPEGDRKSTRLNSSHSQISYAVFCLKKKTK